MLELKKNCDMVGKQSYDKRKKKENDRGKVEIKKRRSTKNIIPKGIK